MNNELAHIFFLMRIFTDKGQNKIITKHLSQKTIDHLQKIGCTVEKRVLFRQEIYQISWQIIPVTYIDKDSDDEVADVAHPLKWEKKHKSQLSKSQSHSKLDDVELDAIRIELDLADALEKATTDD